jgi:xylulokinase
MMKEFLLAHDLGTSGNKATLFDLEGHLVASETVPYGTVYSSGNRAEQNPEDWWTAVCESSRRLLSGRDSESIAAVCFSGQMMGCLPVDKQGRALRSHIIYSDQRAIAQTESLTSRIDPAEIYRITGHRASASYAIEKLMWIRDEEPDVYRETSKMLNAKDFMNFRLTGRMVTDYNDASGTNAFDLSSMHWSGPIIEAAKIDGSMLPEAVPSATVIGEVTPEASEATGIAAGTPVVAGAGDGGCATVGIGSVEPGITYNYLGSSSWISTTSKTAVEDPDQLTFTWAHPVPGYLQPCGTMQTAGSSYSWLKDQLARQEGSYKAIDKLVEQSPPGARGIIFLPYLLGERSPRWNPEAKGAFLGLTLESRREDIFRAVLEGVTLNLDVILRILGTAVPISEMRVIGGGAKGAIWRQIMADVYGMDVVTPRYLEEATSMGAAIIGGVGCGIFSDFSAASRFVEIVDRIEPDAERMKAYAPMKPFFEKAYDALEPLFPEMTSLRGDG